VRVRRLVLSEKDRVGIGTFQPKDEKNQDSTELTGDINYRKIAEYGSDSDPRAFNFDGEFNIANRGIVEFIEVLKLDVAFLYDLLGASQEHKIKPKKFAQTDIDEVILGHTNEAEYKKLLNNEFMEALRDRTIKIDIPYITKLTEEIRIYEKDFNGTKIKSKHIAPHTLEVAAMWAVLTRLEDPEEAQPVAPAEAEALRRQGAPRLHAGHGQGAPQGEQARGDGGDQPALRAGQDLERARQRLGRGDDQPVHGPERARQGAPPPLAHHERGAAEALRRDHRPREARVRGHREERGPARHQRRRGRGQKLAANYIDNIKAFTLKERVKNRYTGQDEEPDERLMRSIEEKIEIPENRKDDFRREIMNFIGALAVDGKRFEWNTNDRLRRALELKLFEDQKDSIKLKTLVSAVVDKDTQEKIDIIKSRLIKNFGYNEVSATDVLNYVASIFARGDAKD
jgi:serine protein kinase